MGFSAGNGPSEGCSPLRALAGKIREGGADFSLLHIIPFAATEIECKPLTCQKSLFRSWY